MKNIIKQLWRIGFRIAMQSRRTVAAYILSIVSTNRPGSRLGLRAPYDDRTGWSTWKYIGIRYRDIATWLFSKPRSLSSSQSIEPKIAVYKKTVYTRELATIRIPRETSLHYECILHVYFQGHKWCRSPLVAYINIILYRRREIVHLVLSCRTTFVSGTHCIQAVVKAWSFKLPFFYSDSFRVTSNTWRLAK